ncbi:hypothetical protein SUGI_0049590 [Cryptomeria japonica]|nr:hypothetical protein SUGI_0049590 [Cryptomeria japonica]
MEKREEDEALSAPWASRLAYCGKPLSAGEINASPLSLCPLSVIWSSHDSPSGNENKSGGLLSCYGHGGP